MKSFVLATFLAATSAFAGTMVTHDYQQVLGDIGLKNACITEDTVRTINPVRTCATELKARLVKGQGDGAVDYYEWYCPRYVRTHLEHSRYFERTVCTDLRKIGYGESEMLECKAYGTKTDYLPEVIPLQVWEERGESSTWPGKTKYYRFPACNSSAQD